MLKKTRCSTKTSVKHKQKEVDKKAIVCYNTITMKPTNTPQNKEPMNFDESLNPSKLKESLNFENFSLQDHDEMANWHDFVADTTVEKDNARIKNPLEPLSAMRAAESKRLADESRGKALAATAIRAAGASDSVRTS